MTAIYEKKHGTGSITKFLHIRTNDPWLSAYTDTWEMSAVRTSDNKVDTSYGGLTVAYKYFIVDLGGGTLQVFAECGVAVCNPRDRYVKSIGRALALDRLNGPAERRTHGYHVINLGTAGAGCTLGVNESGISIQEGDGFVRDVLALSLLKEYGY